MTDSPDPLDAFGSPRDPLDDPLLLQHSGVVRLRAARDLLLAGEAVAAVSAASDARSTGLPAEVVPHAHLLHGAALLLAGRAGEAATILGDGWRDHPDFSALPALLGVARSASGDATSAAHSMYAALVTDDPDRSLALHRTVLTRCRGLLAK